MFDADRENRALSGTCPVADASEGHTAGVKLECAECTLDVIQRAYAAGKSEAWSEAIALLESRDAPLREGMGLPDHARYYEARLSEALWLLGHFRERAR